MPYMILSEDHPDSLPLRKKARSKHLERLHKLHDQGRLIIAGPCPALDSVDDTEAGFSGSLIIAEFDSLLLAEQWAKTDPYIEAGVYKSIMVRPFKQVLPI